MTGLNIYGDLLGWIPWWVWIVLVVGLIVYAAWMWLRIRGTSGRGTLQQQRDRSSQWAGARDVFGLVIKQPDSRRLPLGELAVASRRPMMLACPVGGSKLIVGPAGGGKTARMLVPDLLQHRGPAVVTSVKTDLLWLTLHRRADQGPIWVLNPSESAGLGTCRFSPLMYIHSFDDALRAGQWLSDAGHADDGGIKGQEFWDSLARRMLAPALFLAARENHTLDDVFGWIQIGAEDFITQRLDVVGDQRAVRAWKAHRGTHEKTKSSIVATAYNLLEGWSSEVMGKVTNTRDGEGDLLDIDRLLDQRGTLYLIASNADQHIYRAVFESVINATVRRVQEREEASGRPLRPALLLSLDEAANIAPLRDLAHIVSSGRGQGIIVESVWQDLAQIRRIYGAAAEEVKSNHIAKVYLKGISDVGTLNELSTLLGKTIRSTINHSRDLHDQRRSVSMSEEEVDLATPGELRRLGPDETLAIVDHYKPIKLTVPAWFESPAMRDLIDPGVAQMMDEAFALDLADDQPTSRRGLARLLPAGRP
ncbi:type IV secretory system conjugative DNA transfer family protein [Microlunatus ginsengisoli]|uniref:Type IV secretory system conjugative DNA transfer family protein n=1 Tax=Microlunatus ginsengisoli TaxID=363863 RepID=A0ABP6ZD48_9ACTN